MKLKLIIVQVLAVILLLSFAGVARADAVGVDVSRHQGFIEWDWLRPHINFAIIKAGGSDGEFYTDGQFYRNRDEARRLGLPLGYYYYAGGNDPAKEAEHFVSIMGGDIRPGEVLAMDYEIDHFNPVGYVLTFLIRTEQLTGMKPMLYTNMNRVWNTDWSMVVNNGNHLWGAIYDQNGSAPNPGSWPGVAIKQYSSDGVLPGIGGGGSIDLNILRSNVAGDFQNLSYAAKPKPIPEPEPPKPQPLEINYGLTEATEKVLPGAGDQRTAEVAPAESGEANDANAAGEPSVAETGSGSEVAVDGAGVTDARPAEPAAQDSHPAPAISETPQEESTGGSVVAGILFPIKQIMKVATGGDEVTVTTEAATVVHDTGEAGAKGAQADSEK